jgi:hypothetical protein
LTTDDTRSDEDQTAYVRGAGGTITLGTVRRITEWSCIVVLAALLVVLVLQASSENERKSRLRSVGVPVEVTITACYGIASGTGITHQGFSCSGTFSLGAHGYNENFAGTNTDHIPGQVVSAVVDPRHPANIRLEHEGDAARPSWTAYLGAGGVAILLVVVVCAAYWRKRRRRKREVPGRTLGSL